MLQYKYLREFHFVLCKIQDMQKQEKSVDVFERLISDEEVINTLAKIGIESPYLEEIVKDICRITGLIEELKRVTCLCPENLPESSLLPLKEKVCFFRLCKTDKVSPTDFLPHPFDIEEKRRMQFYGKIYMFSKVNEEIWEKKVCEFFGLSIAETVEDLRNLVSNIKSLTKTYHYIAKLEVNEASGKVFFTPSKKNPSHCSWFPYSNVDEVNTVISTESL